MSGAEPRGRLARAARGVALALAAVALLAAPARAQDADLDGVPDASDNCPFVPNAGQSDVGGFGDDPPDGIGDACQCGDLDGDGRVDLVDAAVYQRDLAGLAPEASNPDTCSAAGGRLDCDGNDLRAIREQLVGLAPGASQVCQAAVGAPPLPMDIAASGDSISRGFAASCGCNDNFFCLLCVLAGDQPQNNWFDGSSGSVESVHDRYLALDGSIGSDNAAVTGAEMRAGADNFSDQADEILAQAPLPEFVVVELGGNDVCSRDCVDPGHCGNPVYSDAEWTEAVRAGLDKLVAGLPLGATVHLLGMPRVQELRAAGVAKQGADPDVDCEGVWGDFSICSIATQAADLNGEDLLFRLFGVADRQIRYNEILRDEALAYTTNGNGRNPRGIEVVSDYVNETTPSVGTTSFGPDDINGGDCFHPSIGGQNFLGGVAWDGNPRR